MEESIVSKGITEDYLWQEAKAMSAKIAELHGALQEFATVVANRDKDNRNVIAKLYAENHQLYQENYLLKGQVETLMEEWRKHNGPIT